MPRKRPNPLQWLWYAYGGRLPDRCREWVLHDLTCRTWVLRYLLRALVQMSPGLLFLLVPGPLWLLAMSLLGGVLMGLFYSVSGMHETAEHRLAKHGYPVGTGRRTREEDRGMLNPDQAARYAAIYRRGND